MLKSFIDYLIGVRSEFSHIKWPSTGQALGYTALVILISIIVASLSGGLDFVFTLITEKVIGAI